MLGKKEKLDRVELLLRQHGAAPLSAGFKRDVLQAIAHLPDPELVTPQRGIAGLVRAMRLLSAGELVAIGLVLLGLVITLIPSVGNVLTGWHWELASLDVSISIGSMALSGSLLSMIAIVIGAAFMAGVGAYATRNHLIGA
jgi:hypothetical protein